MNTFAYTYIGTGSPFVTMNLVIWGAYIGIVLACIISVIERNANHDIVEALFESGADSPENAVTLEKLGLKSKNYLRRLRRDKRIRRYVSLADADSFVKAADKTSASYKLARAVSQDRDDAEKLTPAARFYISEENRIGAEVHFVEKRKSGWLSVVTCAVLLAVVMALMTYAMPRLMGMLDSLIKAAAGK